MSMMDNVKQVGVIVTAITIGYGVVVKAGWVVGRADAATMIESALQQSAAQINGALLEEMKARQRADITFQIEFATQKAIALMNLPAPTAAQQMELAQIRNQINQLNTQLATLQ